MKRNKIKTLMVALIAALKILKPYEFELDPFGGA
jgi:hypothetical protein